MMPDQFPDRLVFAEKALFQHWGPGGTVDAESIAPTSTCGGSDQCLEADQRQPVHQEAEFARGVQGGNVSGTGGQKDHPDGPAETAQTGGQNRHDSQPHRRLPNQGEPDHRAQMSADWKGTRNISLRIVTTAAPV